MEFPVIHFGIETEYGISIDHGDDIDLVAESMELVRCVSTPGVWKRWDYACEDPHQDARGFHVVELLQDEDEAQYAVLDAQRPLSYQDIKTDFVLSNGARFYNDHAHPEYCTPECVTLADLSAHDRAGERILMACVARRSRKLGREVMVYKNNTDFCGHSYGCHENYLVPRSLSWDALAGHMTNFLVTRQIYAGAGKFALEAEDEYLGGGFQISQRSDFFSVLQSVDTMQARPIINTRDEPHADPRRYRRFHVIIGDANMSPFVTRLKVGATALVLEALARNPHARLPVIEDPVGALKRISRDPTFRWECRLADRRATTAMEVQRAFLDLARHGCELNPEKAALLCDWEGVLEDLAIDYRQCQDRLDWVAKLQLIRSFQAEQGVADDDPWLASLDLEYHRLDPAKGLYLALEAQGRRPAVPAMADVEKAMAFPPSNTRAAVRGGCVQKFSNALISAQWDHVTLEGDTQPLRISLLDLFAPEDILRYVRAVEKAHSPEDLRWMEQTGKE